MIYANEINLALEVALNKQLFECVLLYDYMNIFWSGFVQKVFK